MKTNEAPEKIILSADRETGILYDELVIRDLTDNIKIEYIRKDAFIEKATEFFNVYLLNYINVKANCDVFINIDGDKLKEDFRNYMEGE